MTTVSTSTARTSRWTESVQQCMSTKGLVIAEMEKAYEWLLEECDIDGAAARILRNVLEYADRMGGDEQYDFLAEMLDGTIGLSDREIRNLCWN